METLSQHCSALLQTWVGGGVMNYPLALRVSPDVPALLLPSIYGTDPCYAQLQSTEKAERRILVLASVIKSVGNIGRQCIC